MALTVLDCHVRVACRRRTNLQHVNAFHLTPRPDYEHGTCETAKAIIWPWRQHRTRRLPPPREYDLRISTSQRFRGGLVFKAHRLLYHRTLGSRVIKKKKNAQHVNAFHLTLMPEYGFDCLTCAMIARQRYASHPGGTPGANLKSISHRCHPILVAFVWEVTRETINFPQVCLQGGQKGESARVRRACGERVERKEG
jgi:hypothetical protein